MDVPDSVFLEGLFVVPDLLNSGFSPVLQFSGLKPGAMGNRSKPAIVSRQRPAAESSRPSENRFLPRLRYFDTVPAIEVENGLRVIHELPFLCRDSVKRKLVLAITAALLLFIVLLFLQARRDSHLRVRRIPIHHPAFADILSGKRIVLLSDVHFRAGAEAQLYADSLLRSIRALQPDMIFLLGDLVRWFGGRADYRPVWDFLSQLHAPLGVFAVMGDADYTFPRESCKFCHLPGSAAPPRLHQVRFLRDTLLTIDTERGRIQLAGIDCGPDMKPDATVISRWDLSRPTLLLSHTSLVYSLVPAEAPVLVLSGDTHGGQILLPTLFWKLTRRKPDPEHMYGFYHDGRKMLYVTSGTGTSSLPIRLGVPPEIVQLEFGDEQPGRTARPSNSHGEKK